MFLAGGLTYNSYPLSASCVSDSSFNLLRPGYGAVSQSSGGDVAFRPFGLLNLFPVFPCDMVVGTFFMSFLGGKYFKAVVSVLVYEIPTLRLPGNYV